MNMGISEAVSMVGLGLTVLGTAMAIWARNLSTGTKALKSMEQSITTIVSLRLGSIEEKVADTSADVKVLVKEVHEIKEDYHARLRVLETLKQNKLV